MSDDKRHSLGTFWVALGRLFAPFAVYYFAGPAPSPTKHSTAGKKGAFHPVRLTLLGRIADILGQSSPG